MTPDQAYETVADSFRLAWADETPVDWESGLDVKGLPEYVRFSWQPTQGSQIDLGPRGTHRHEGVLFVQVFTEWGNGQANQRNRVLQGRVLEWLERFDQAVTFINAHAQYVGRSDAWLQFNVSADFHYDSQRAA